jgi:hypothetical protein
MIAICGICGMIAAKSQQQILQVGWILLAAVTLHNLFGYLLGYWGSKIAGLNEADSRTIAIEVGLQNGGLCSKFGDRGSQTRCRRNCAGFVCPSDECQRIDISNDLESNRRGTATRSLLTG